MAGALFFDYPNESLLCHDNILNSITTAAPRGDYRRSVTTYNYIAIRICRAMALQLLTNSLLTTSRINSSWKTAYMKHPEFVQLFNENCDCFWKTVCDLAIKSKRNLYGGMTLDDLQGNLREKFFEPLSKIPEMLKRERDKVFKIPKATSRNDKKNGVALSWSKMNDKDYDLIPPHHFLLWQKHNHGLNLKFDREVPPDENEWLSNIAFYGDKDDNHDQFFSIVYVEPDDVEAGDYRQELVWLGRRISGGVVIDDGF